MFNKTTQSLCGVVRECPLPRSVVVTAKWVVSCTLITCIQPLSRCTLTFPASSFFSESVCLLLLFCFLSLLFHHMSFFFYLWLTGQSVPAVICICFHPDAMSSVVLINNLLYQPADMFLDGGQISEGLVKVSLAFHLFVIGTVIFASVLLCQVKKFFIPSKENVGATHKEQRQGTYIKD